ncbi:protein kinase domain-containing protein [Stutzerimonas xanthomarina]|jgi:hypothetical protein|uniref:class III lanthionine synthetase LanKC N-terminal domain-containing protein n=1 Tax=Stutzerimonas xanthomarina TaxID=271420 RepID=UPI003AA91ACB
MDKDFAELQWSSLCNRLCGECSSEDFWRLYSPKPIDLPNQGWKLHLSATPRNSLQMLKAAVSAANKYGVAVKFPRKIVGLAILNSGIGSALSQAGKIFTFYSDSETKLLKAAEELGRKTNRFRCPTVTYDEPVVWGRNIFFRYGVISGDAFTKVIGPSGDALPDERGKGKAIPAWAKNSNFVRAIRGNKQSRHSATRLLPCDLLVFEAISQRAKGGVYKALDLSVIPGRIVALKEGRLDGELNVEGLEGYKLARREARNLRSLHKLGFHVPKVYRTVDVSTHFYVATEYLGTNTLDKFYNTETEEKLNICRSLMREIASLNNAGWMWRDCKPANIIISEGRIYLIDMEGACKVEKSYNTKWGSPGYIPDFSVTPRRLQDIYAGLLSCGQLIASNFKEIDNITISEGINSSAISGTLKELFYIFLESPTGANIERLLQCLCGDRRLEVLSHIAKS